MGGEYTKHVTGRGEEVRTPCARSGTKYKGGERGERIRYSSSSTEISERKQRWYGESGGKVQGRLLMVSVGKYICRYPNGDGVTDGIDVTSLGCMSTSF